MGTAAEVTTIAPTTLLATDVGLWMALPAFGPAVIVVAAVIVLAKRDRRRTAAGDELPEDDLEAEQ